MAKLLFTNGASFPHLVKYGHAKLGETRHIYLNAAKGGRELGWFPTLNLEEGFVRIVAYFKKKEQAA